LFKREVIGRTVVFYVTIVAHGPVGDLTILGMSRQDRYIDPGHSLRNFFDGFVFHVTVLMFCGTTTDPHAISSDGAIT
jgi:hypothetical protein